jgi:flagella basal body P-ring formation protein FlgA
MNARTNRGGAVFWLLVLAGVLLVTVDAAAEVHLRFRDKVDVVTPTYTLKDIVELDRLADPLKGRLANVQIGLAPRPGQWTQVTQVEVAAVLESDLPGVTRNLPWRGPAYVRIRGGGVRCDMTALQQAAQSFLLDQLGKRYDDVTVRLVSKPRPVIAAAGKATFSPKMSPVWRLSKRMPVWVDVLVAGRHFQTVPLWFEVAARMPVWVVQSELRRKQSITVNSVKKCLRDIVGLEGKPLSTDSLEGMRTVRELTPGTILSTDLVEPIPAVSRGEMISVAVSHGGVHLQVKAIALTDGRISQQIVVKNPGSGGIFRAKVIDIKKAMVN